MLCARSVAISAPRENSAQRAVTSHQRGDVDRHWFAPAAPTIETRPRYASDSRLDYRVAPPRIDDEIDALFLSVIFMTDFTTSSVR